MFEIIFMVSEGVNYLVTFESVVQLINKINQY